MKMTMAQYAGYVAEYGEFLRGVINHAEIVDESELPIAEAVTESPIEGLEQGKKPRVWNRKGKPQGPQQRLKEPVAPAGIPYPHRVIGQDLYLTYRDKEYRIPNKLFEDMGIKSRAALHLTICKNHLIRVDGDKKDQKGSIARLVWNCFNPEDRCDGSIVSVIDGNPCNLVRSNLQLGVRS